jgi:hypothetical protein
MNLSFRKILSCQIPVGATPNPMPIIQIPPAGTPSRPTKGAKTLKCTSFPKQNK